MFENKEGEVKINNPNVIKQQQTDLSWIKNHMISAQKRRWYGKMTIEIKNGMVDIMRFEQTFKPPKKEN